MSPDFKVSNWDKKSKSTSRYTTKYLWGFGKQEHWSIVCNTHSCMHEAFIQQTFNEWIPSLYWPPYWVLGIYVVVSSCSNLLIPSSSQVPKKTVTHPPVFLILHAPYHQICQIHRLNIYYIHFFFYTHCHILLGIYNSSCQHNGNHVFLALHHASDLACSHLVMVQTTSKRRMHTVYPLWIYKVL